MPITLNGTKYYRTAEACTIAGISRTTFLRWVREGTITDVLHRDRKGWRLFTGDDLARIEVKANHIQKMEWSDNES